MRVRFSLYRSEFFKTFVQYLCVALAFVPFGVAYGVVVLTHGESLGALLALLGAGFIAAQFVWRRTEIVLARQGVRLPEAAAAPAAFVLLWPSASSAPAFRYAVLTAATVLSAAVSPVRTTTAEQGKGTEGHARVLILTGN